MIEEYLGKSTCRNCGEAIDAGDDRVVVMAVEIRGEDADAPKPSRGDSYQTVFCSKCVADVSEFKFSNPWKFVSDAMAHPSAGPPSEDLFHRATIRLQEQSPSREDFRLPDKSDRRRRVHDFIQSAQSKRMPKELRAIAALFAHGNGQVEIAKALNLTQPTVSRRMEQVFEWVNKS